MNGILVISKDIGYTSRDVINIISVKVLEDKIKIEYEDKEVK